MHKAIVNIHPAHTCRPHGIVSKGVVLPAQSLLTIVLFTLIGPKTIFYHASHTLGSGYHQSQDVALTFSDMLYKKEHPEAKYRTSPGAAQKVKSLGAVQKVKSLGAVKKVLNKTSGTIVPEDDGGVSAFQENAAVDYRPEIVSLHWRARGGLHHVTYAPYYYYHYVLPLLIPLLTLTTVTYTNDHYTTDSKEAN